MSDIRHSTYIVTIEVRLHRHVVITSQVYNLYTCNLYRLTSKHIKHISLLCVRRLPLHLDTDQVWFMFMLLILEHRGFVTQKIKYYRLGGTADETKCNR